MSDVVPPPPEGGGALAYCCSRVSDKGTSASDAASVIVSKILSVPWVLCPPPCCIWVPRDPPGVPGTNILVVVGGGIAPPLAPLDTFVPTLTPSGSLAPPHN